MSTPLLENILNQPRALAAVAAYQAGEGRAALDRAAALLRGKKKIIVSGMGASLFACYPFQYALTSRGFDVIAVETAELLYFAPSAINRETAVILVSRSGESVEVTKLLPWLRSRGAAVIGVVNVAASALSAAADQAIVIGSPGDQMVAIQTYTGTVATFALLAAALAEEWVEAKADFAATLDALTAWIPSCVSGRAEWDKFLQGSWPIYILGRGAATGTVLEGVLLMHETAKAPAVGISVAQFRHGPVEVTDERFRAIVIGTQPATRELDRALVNDIAEMGGEARWIGPAANGAPLLCEWPKGNAERLNGIAEVIPLQVAAYRKAELNGVRPGDFRWAPLVTTSEAGFLPGKSGPA